MYIKFEVTERNVLRAANL